MNHDPANLEIVIRRRDAQQYLIDFAFDYVGSDAVVRPLPRQPTLVQFDLEQLRSLTLDAAAYGRALSAMLFAAPAAREAFTAARATAEAQHLQLRVRIAISPDAPELHALRWECLFDPDGRTMLALSERILLSRYIASTDWRQIRLRARTPLRALVVIAAPTNLASYGLAPIPPDDQRDAVAALSPLQTTLLSTPADTTLAAIMHHLRDGYDILYLVCHGRMRDQHPYLVLSNERGEAAFVSGTAFADRIDALTQRPRLIVLASCRSAADNEHAALVALGPQLAEGGVPAVLAMQGNVLQTTVHTLMPVFFRELQRDGQIDRALAVARTNVRDLADAWAPALFMRLKSGRFWYEPGFTPGTFAKWPTFLDSINAGHCTAILGPGLIEPYVGTYREIARRWAETYHFPMDAGARENLPQVAQYLAIDQDKHFLLRQLGASLQNELVRRYAKQFGAGFTKLDLNKMLRVVWAQQSRQTPNDPYRMLARTPFKIYLTTNVDDLLPTALQAAGKRPHVVTCPWNKFGDAVAPQQRFEPSVQEPLVYQLFGAITDPDSLVLTEDDYFRYLIGLSRERDLVPDVVQRALTDSPLLFLGFYAGDWNFRVLFQSIMNLPGRQRQRHYTHVAAQIYPEVGRTEEPERARIYLERYFGQADLSIYWGHVDDFVGEIQAKLKAAGA